LNVITINFEIHIVKKLLKLKKNLKIFTFYTSVVFLLSILKINCNYIQNSTKKNNIFSPLQYRQSQRLPSSTTGHRWWCPPPSTLTAHRRRGRGTRLPSELGAAPAAAAAEEREAGMSRWRQRFAAWPPSKRRQLAS
jgi:hypothetical protein